MSWSARHAISTKAAAPHELARRLRPARRLLERERHPVEELEADRVAVAPVLEACGPGVHLAARHALRVAHERRQQARLVPPALPRAPATARGPSRGCFASFSSVPIGTPKAPSLRDAVAGHPRTTRFDPRRSSHFRTSFAFTAVLRRPLPAARQLRVALGDPALHLGREHGSRAASDSSASYTCRGARRPRLQFRCATIVSGPLDRFRGLALPAGCKPVGRRLIAAPLGSIPSPVSSSIRARSSCVA